MTSIIQGKSVFYYQMLTLTLKTPKMKRMKFANSADPDEVAHNEPPHLDLHCLPSNL